MNTKTACLLALVLLAAATRTLLDSHEVEAAALPERRSLACSPRHSRCCPAPPRLQAAPSAEAAGKPEICRGEWEENEFECFFACADDGTPAPYEVECKCQEDSCTKAACYIKSPAHAKFTFECPIEAGRVRAAPRGRCAGTARAGLQGINLPPAPLNAGRVVRPRRLERAL